MPTIATAPGVLVSAHNASNTLPFWTFDDVKAEVEYSGCSAWKIDLETGEVASVGIHATRDTDETPSEVSVSLESETDQPDEVFDRTQQLVDTAAPFELHGWWAPAPTNGGHQSPSVRPTPIARRRTRR
jgi:hypothetical protein